MNKHWYSRQFHAEQLSHINSINAQNSNDLVFPALFANELSPNEIKLGQYICRGISLPNAIIPRERLYAVYVPYCIIMWCWFGLFGYFFCCCCPSINWRRAVHRTPQATNANRPTGRCLAISVHMCANVNIALCYVLYDMCCVLCAVCMYTSSHLDTIFTIPLPASSCSTRSLVWLRILLNTFLDLVAYIS